MTDGTARAKTTVLTVEDDEAILQPLAEALTDDGYHVLTARTAAAAIALAQRESVGVILLDLGLPDAHGNSVVATLKGDPVTSTIPIIVVSAYPQQLNYISHVDAVITKPFNLDDLFFEVERVTGLAER